MKVPDHYYKKAKRQNYLSRASFKLIQIDEKYNIIKSKDKVLELGCSPGGWTQVVLDKIGEEGRVVGVDIVESKLTHGNFEFLKGDIFDDELWKKVEEKAPFDVLLSDVAPKTTGIPFRDSHASMEMVRKIIERSKILLRKGGNALIKVFMGEGFDELVRDVKKFFNMVKIHKPPASRKESKEIYLVMKGLKGLFIALFLLSSHPSLSEEETPSLLKRAVLEVNKGNFDTAENLFKKVFELYPQSPAVLRAGGYIYLKMQKYDLAEKYLKEAVDRDSTDHISLNNLGVLYALKGELDRAIFYFNLAAKSKASTTYYYNLASTFYEIGNYEESLNALEALLKIDPQMSPALFLRGIVFYETGRKDEARKIFESLLLSSETRVIGLTGIATIEESEGNLEKSIEFMREAVSLSPEDPFLRFHLANLYFQAGNYERAKMEYENVLKIGRSNDLLSASHIMSAIASANLGDFRKYFLEKDKKLLKDLEEEKLPFDPLSFLVSGIKFRELGNYDVAIAVLKMALKKESMIKDIIYLEIGKTFFLKAYYGLSEDRVKDFEQASNYLHQSFIINNREPETPLFLGLSKYYAGIYDKKGGQRSLFQAMSIFKNLTGGPYKNQAYYYLTLSSYMVGDCENAVKFFGDYMKSVTSPEPNLFLIAGDCKIKSQKREEALSLFQEYLKYIPEDDKVREIVFALEEEVKKVKKEKK